MESFVNSALVSCIRTGFNPTLGVAQGFRSAAERSKAAVERVLVEQLRLDALIEHEQKTGGLLQSALESGQWKAEFRGRDVLQRFSNLKEIGVGYERFRNLCASRMAEAGYQPEGMKKIVDAIMRANGK
jgi:hypothetical protein